MLGPLPKKVHVVSSYRCVVQLRMCQACGLRTVGSRHCKRQSASRMSPPIIGP